MIGENKLWDKDNDSKTTRTTNKIWRSVPKEIMCHTKSDLCTCTSNNWKERVF